MAIFDRMAALWRRWRPVPEVMTPASDGQAAVLLFNVESGRRAKVQDSRRMVEDDPRPDQVLATLARDAIKGGFALQVTGPRDAAALAVAEAMIERLDLATRLDDWVRLTLRDGDSFLEIGVTEDGEIEVVTRKPTLEMVRNSNRYDLFDAPGWAFYWSDMPWAIVVPGSNVL